jgi:hypothetical protein
VDSRLRINQELPQYPCLTFCWPYWHSSAICERIISRYYLAARAGGVNISQYQYVSYNHNPENTDVYQIDSYGILSNPEALNLFQLLLNAHRRHDWAVICFHGISDFAAGIDAVGYSPVTRDEFEKILDFIQVLDSWAAPLAAVAKYRSESNLIKITLLEANQHYLVLTAEDGLDDRIYNQAVTIAVNLPADWEQVRVEQHKIVMWSYCDQGVLYADVFPDGGRIVISASS